MQAILIDPFTRTITEVDYNGDYTNIYEHIKAECFDCVRINRKGDSIFVDDEGLINGDANQQFFGWLGYANPIAGRGLILGTDSEGESISPSITMETVLKHVIWLSPSEVSFTLPTVTSF